VPNGDRLSADSLLLPLAREGHGPPLFLIPAAGSAAFSLARLARALSPGSSVYSFVFAGMQNNVAPHGSVEEMAARYIAEVKTVQRTGPYYLGGYCFGGIPAFEMAAQLESKGEAVAVVIPIESFPPRHENPEQTGNHAEGPRNPPLSTSRAGDPAASVAERIEKQLLRIPAGLKEMYEELTLRHLRMEADYRARPIEAPIAQVRSRTYPGRSYQGWAGLTTGGYTERVVPADTDSMLDPSNVATLCSELRAIIDRFQ
jgi:thioesterase domain-containing protein